MLAARNVCLSFAIVLFITANAQAAPISYQISDLGTLPGTTQSIATGINAQGQVVGVSYSSSDGTWTANGALFPLGISYDAGAKSFLFSSGQMTQINPTDGLANAINNAGQIVGGHYSSINNSGAYVGSTGVGVVLQNAASVPQELVSGGKTILLTVAPMAINDSGQIAGGLLVQAPGAGYVSHAAVYQNGQVTDLSNSLGLKGSGDVVTALNNQGDMIITEGSGTKNPAHYLYYDSHSNHLADLTTTAGGQNFIALALNNQGQIVGNGLLYSNGQFTSLQSLIPASSGWSNLVATAINDAGQIAGQGLIGGQEHAFLMSPEPMPVPEPLSLTVFGLGFALLGVRARLARSARG